MPRNSDLGGGAGRDGAADVSDDEGIAIGVSEVRS
jgi:hypothetical protein